MGTLSCDIFNTGDNTLSHMCFDGVNNVYSFCQTSDHEIIAASASGLYSLNIAGTPIYKICNGHFMDVCSINASVVAVELIKCEVHTFQRNDGKWNLRHICVQGGVVYVSYNWEKMICKYLLTGEFLKQYGSEKKGQALGQFDGPIVSGTDCHHSLIVCDSNNHRIQVKKSYGQWREYRLPEGIRGVTDVLVIKHRLYVLWKNGDKNKILTVFTLKL